MSSSEAVTSKHTRTYDRRHSVVFLKTHEPFGGLSNMASGFPIYLNGIVALTSEALYQSCRFPHLPDVQMLILAQRSPMTAKMVGKPYRADSRPDWDRVRVKVMRWCLRAKLLHNWQRFGDVLLATGELPIVEESRRDDFWGAKPIDSVTLTGSNILGRLLMELREEVRRGAFRGCVTLRPPQLPNFMLLGVPVPTLPPIDTEQHRHALI